jgi:hypothetical protein
MVISLLAFVVGNLPLEMANINADISLLQRGLKPSFGELYLVFLELPSRHFQPVCVHSLRVKPTTAITLNANHPIRIEKILAMPVDKPVKV